MQPEMIADYQCDTGENPLWHPDEQKLYWVDIPAGKLFRYAPASGTHEQFYQGDVIGGFTIQEDGALLLFMAKGAVKVLKDGQLKTVVEEIPEERDTRFNDVIADPEGRVFCGTMVVPAHKGGLYRLDTGGSITKLLDGVDESNGLGFTRDLSQMYYTDSDKREIYVFDYDRTSGAISNRRTFVRTPEDGSVPDGLTVDAEGYIWSARWDGGCLVRYRPDGTEERRIQFPAKKVSSLTFGGADYKDIYVTTAGGYDKATEGAGAGALFRLRLGIQGVPEFRSKIRAS